MKLALADDWTATVTGEPLRITPRFDLRDFRVRIATYAFRSARAERGPEYAVTPSCSRTYPAPDQRFRTSHEPRPRLNQRVPCPD